MSQQRNLRLLFLGNSEVGKKSILLRYVNGTFSEHFIATVGIDYRVKVIEFEGQLVKLEIWVSAGQERFRSLTKNYFKGANGFIFVYDISNKYSLDSVKNWITEAMTYAYIKGNQMIIVGNKKDLCDHRKISTDYIKAFAEKYNAQFIESSAKTGEGVEEIFNILVKEIFKGINSEEDEFSIIARDSKRLKVGKNKNKNSSDCNC